MLGASGLKRANIRNIYVDKDTASTLINVLSTVADYQRYDFRVRINLIQLFIERKDSL